MMAVVVDFCLGSQFRTQYVCGTASCIQGKDVCGAACPVLQHLGQQKDITMYALKTVAARIGNVACIVMTYKALVVPAQYTPSSQHRGVEIV